MQNSNLISVLNPKNGEELGTLDYKRPGAFNWKPADSRKGVDFPPERISDWLHSLLDECDNVEATVRLRPAPTKSGMDPINSSERSPLPRASGAAAGVRRGPR